MQEHRLITAVAAVAMVIGLSACAGDPSIVGVWQPASGGEVKTVLDDGTCSGFYYADGEPLDIGGTTTCQLSGSGDDGAYLLVVEQPPNRATYPVTFAGDDTMSIDVGPTVIELERR